ITALFGSVSACSLLTDWDRYVSGADGGPVGTSSDSSTGAATGGSQSSSTSTKSAGGGGGGGAAPCVGLDEKEDPSTGHCYRLFADEKTFDLAETACGAWGGHLVGVQSASEQSLIDTLITDNAWLGGTDLHTPGTFTWVNGEPWTYDNWNIGEPSGG